MATITTRAGKGSELTHTEVDNNFTNLNTAKYEAGDNIDVGTITADNTLQLEGAGPSLKIKDTDSLTTAVSSNIQFLDSADGVHFQMGYLSGSNSDFDIFQAEAAAIDFWTNSAFAMSIESSGVTFPHLGLNTDGQVAFNVANADVNVTINGNNGVCAFFDGGTNDIAFYNSAGTTQSFYWDSATTSLSVAGSTGPTWSAGSGSPESVVTAPVGSFYSRTDGGTGTSFYVKESGTGNTGWVAK